jgi:hypothetical protein
MAYDIHLGLTETEASMSLAVLSIDGNLHDYVFSINNKELQKYTLIFRMQDYYADGFYHNQELKDFLRELIDFERVFSVDKAKAKLADDLIKVCNIALTQNANIYCFAD